MIRPTNSFFRNTFKTLQSTRSLFAIRQKSQGNQFNSFSPCSSQFSILSSSPVNSNTLNLFSTNSTPFNLNNISQSKSQSRLVSSQATQGTFFEQATTSHLSLIPLLNNEIPFIDPLVTIQALLELPTPSEPG